MQGCDQCHKSHSEEAIIVSWASGLEAELCNIFIKVLNNEQNLPSASLLMIQSGEEWLILLMFVLP